MARYKDGGRSRATTLLLKDKQLTYGDRGARE